MEKDKELIIEPMEFYGPGGCQKCGTCLYVSDAEITMMELNREGIPISEETVIRCKALCPNCGEEYPMKRYHGGYIPDTRDNAIWLHVKALEAARDRLNKLSAKRFTGNPLVLG